MATDRDDPGSWRSRDVQHRDQKHSHDGPEVLPERRKKDTKRWCKGKEGREHDYSVLVPWGMRTGLFEKVCSQCLKKHHKFEAFDIKGNRVDWMTGEKL